MAEVATVPVRIKNLTDETTILYMSARHNPAQVLHETATVYKAYTDAIALKVKQEFATKDKLKKAPKAAIKAKKAA